MRTSSANVAKGGTPYCHQVPAPGTKTRELYDLFYGNKGKVIDWRCTNKLSRVMDDLRDYYGLDIRSLGPRKWLLAGEWFGRVYVDYTVNPDL